MSDMNDLEYVAYLRNECQPLLTSPDMRNLAVGVYLGELIDRLLESNAEIERLRATQYKCNCAYTLDGGIEHNSWCPSRVIPEQQAEIERLRAQMIVDAEQLVKVGRECERLRAENVRIEQQLIAAHEKIEQLRSAIRERLGYPGEHIPCGCVACKELEALGDE